jgi:uncharacterized protein with HEPN domain
MRRKSIKIIQLCCPYCGNIEIIIKKCCINEIEHYNYCPCCGKGSTSDNSYFQLSRMIRIIHFHSTGLAMIKDKSEYDKLELLTYDVYQLELVEISALFEVMLRDYFNAFLFIQYFGIKSKYLSKTLKKDIGNDFLNIDKANTHYKQALGINLRAKISESNWLDLIDLVNMRNTIVHNNGMIDLKFKNTKSYLRLKDKINGNLLFLNPKDILYYFEIVNSTIEILSNLFEKMYEEKKYVIIANHYFNSAIN